MRDLEGAAAAGQARWFEAALARLRALRAADDARVRDFLSGAEPVFLARAPGRLDVMGGIADYSGSSVLELPLGRAVFAAVQRQSEARCDVLTFREGSPQGFSVPTDWLVDGALSPPEALAAWLEEQGGDGWPAYVAGVVQLCLRRVPPVEQAGLRILIHSEVPEGRGVSSSAALEVACMMAVAACLGLRFPPEEIAALCQWVENHVVGAPCGIMDQMTSACGRQDRLLRLRCQPALVEGYLAVPDGYRFFGIDSGIQHAIAGVEYGTVRAAAFMGYRIIAEAAGLRARPGSAEMDDPHWGGYLANVRPAELESRFGALLPERMLGAEFLARYGGITDTVTQVRPEVEYPVRQATAHPVYENARVERFAQLLAELPRRPAAADEMGRLMYESHASYGACGLGSEGTDRLVALVRGAGAGVFGAKITGGGSGGTVAVFGTDAAETAVRALAARYSEETGRATEVFAGSGPGAATTGVIRLATGSW